jgi:hypothetical protein
LLGDDLNIVRGEKALSNAGEPPLHKKGQRILFGLSGRVLSGQKLYHIPDSIPWAREM